MTDSYFHPYDYLSYKSLDFEDYILFEIPSLGISCHNLDELAELVVKMLYFQGDYDFEIETTNNSLHNDDIVPLLSEQIQQMKDGFIRGINNGSLKAEKILRDFDENILTHDTYVSMDVAAEWLDSRNVDIAGDWYRSYQDDMSRLFTSAIHAIKAERLRIKNGEPEEVIPITDSEKVMALEKRVIFLDKKLQETKREKTQSKPLHTKEKDTLFKMVIGMAVTGYGYDPKSKRNTAIKDIHNDLALCGINLDEDTIRKWLNKASEILPQ